MKQRRLLIERMKQGRRLFWFGDNGPELDGFPFWPDKKTVRGLLAEGILRWGEYLNETQKQCGICELVLAQE
jgi:hypothetical protein